MEPAAFALRALIAVAIAAGVYLAWQLRTVWLLTFAAVLVALVLRALADLLQARLRLPPRVAFGGSLAVVAAALLLLGFLIGDRISTQAAELVRAVPQLVERATTWLQSLPVGAAVGDLAGSLGSGEPLLKRLGGVASGVAGATTNALLVLAVGVYLAADPGLYRRGLVRLMPRAARPRIDRALGDAAAALRGWLLGQGMAMVLVAVATGVGLWLLDVRLALVLAILAGVLDFVPVIGPIVAAVPAVLIALAEGPERAAWVALLYLAVQQVEGNVLMPLVQRWATALPPAVALLAIVAFGLLFGLPGVLLGVPLAVLAMSLVRSLYVEPQARAPAPGERG